MELEDLLQLGVNLLMALDRSNLFEVLEKGVLSSNSCLGLGKAF